MVHIVAPYAVLLFTGRVQGITSGPIALNQIKQPGCGPKGILKSLFSVPGRAAQKEDRMVK